MSKLRILYGNILDIKEGIICQQVNCMGVMGSGLAKQIRNKYPRVYEAYIKFVKESDTKVNNLGETLLVEVDKGLYVANMFSQFSYGRSGLHTNYQKFEECLIRLKNTSDNYDKLKNLPIYFPYKIGCGLGGGDWNIISSLIEKVFPNAIIVKLKEE